MPLYIITKPFKWAHGGVRVEEFESGPDPVELPDDCAEVALAEKWAKPAKPAKTPAPTPAPTPTAPDAPAEPSLEPPAAG